jgi:hypothetical protein
MRATRPLTFEEETTVKQLKSLSALALAATFVMALVAGQPAIAQAAKPTAPAKTHATKKHSKKHGAKHVSKVTSATKGATTAAAAPTAAKKAVK